MRLGIHMIWTILLSMVPAVEVKGAVPFGVALGMHPLLAYACAIMGSSVIVIFLAFFTHWFYMACKKRGWLRRFTGWMDKITEKNKDKIQKFGPWAIFAYVAVPVPGTGTWTGGIIAGVLNMKPASIIAAIISGNCVAGLILMAISKGVKNAVSSGMLNQFLTMLPV